MTLIDLAERALVPDVLVRHGIRRLLRRRIREESRADADAQDQRRQQLLERLWQGPLAVHTAEANRQHYEVPTEFFQRVLGPRLKYSCCFYEGRNRQQPGTSELARAEERMLDLTCQRAQLADGQRILELGCGWGSLTLWMAERFPAARITAVSNSRSQREYILEESRRRGLPHVDVITADIREFATAERFDRIVSVEMFEHLRNHRLMLQRIAGWLHASGKLFVHIFCHRDLVYLFETDDPNDWMGRNFFTGGMMPSADLLLECQQHLVLEHFWRVGGLHYARTCDDWLAQLDAQRPALLQLFRRDLPPAEARITLQRWRIFLMACAELFRFSRGREWFVGHYLFGRR